MKTVKNFKAYIASSKESKAFDYAFGKTASLAMAAIKRTYNTAWQSYCIWIVYVHEDGQEEQVKLIDFV